MADSKFKIKLLWIGLLLLTILAASSAAANQAPVLYPIGPKEVVIGKTLSFKLIATDPDHDSVFFSGNNLPIDSYLNPQTGEFRWTPALNQIGNYLFTFRASDDGIPTLSSSESIAVRVIYRLVRHQKAWGFGTKAQESIVETSELSELYPTLTKIEIDGLAYPSTQTMFYTSENPRILLEASSPYHVDQKSVSVLLDGEEVQISDFFDVQTFGEQKNTLSLSFDVTLEDLPEGTHTLSFRGGNDLGFSSQNITLSVGKLRLVEKPLAFPVPFSPTSGGNINLQYTLSQDADIEIFIFSASGQAVRKLVFAKSEEGGKIGRNTIAWDAKTIGGRPAGNGVYIATIISKQNRSVLGKIKLVIY